jgi:hypothetical protein
MPGPARDIPDPDLGSVEMMSTLQGPVRSTVRRLRPSRFARGFAASASVVVLAACTTAPAEETIGRDAFVEAYVDLRISALETDAQVMTDSLRAVVLARHGLTAEDLLGFAEAHARDLEFMRDVWNDVEAQMDARRPSEPEG